MFDITFGQQSVNFCSGLRNKENGAPEADGVKPSDKYEENLNNMKYCDWYDL